MNAPQSMPEPVATLGGLEIRRPSRIEGPVRDLLKGKNVCIVSTHASDGSIHSMPVWVDTDGPNVVLNTVRGRAWVRNLDRDPGITCTVVNMGDPAESTEIRGRVVETSTEGASDHVHMLAKKYLDLDEYPFLEDGERMIVRVAPDRLTYTRAQPS